MSGDSLRLREGYNAMEEEEELIKKRKEATKSRFEQARKIFNEKTHELLVSELLTVSK